MTRLTESQVSRWPWRYRCPEDHASIDMSTNVFWCEQCGKSYAKTRLVDKARRAEP